MKSIKRVLRNLGEVFKRVLETLVGQRQPEPELVPIPVRSGDRRSRY
ncbi:hypothetical protein [Pseudanabaena sp. PCC 6802]|nr:hypothetical protein [Pseudanabaena sp. PCC 6802]